MSLKNSRREKECSSIYSGGFGLNDNKLIKQAFAYGPAENVICVTTMNKNKTITAVFKKFKNSSSNVQDIAEKF